MPCAANREKLYTYIFFALYGLAMLLASSRHLALALLALAASSVCVFQTFSIDSDDRAQQRKKVYLTLAVFMLPGLYVLWTVHQQESEKRKFEAYLAEHSCTYQGNVITGVSQGGCDREGNCEEPQEVEAAEFLCSSTGNRITFADFKAGHYGY